MKRYRVLSPDGFGIECGPAYRSKKAARAAFLSWKAQYTSQGYYSTGRRERIPLSDLAERCDIIIT